MYDPKISPASQKKKAQMLKRWKAYKNTEMPTNTELFIGCNNLILLTTG